MLKKEVYISNSGCRILSSSFEGKNTIGEDTIFTNVTMGFGSYAGTHCDIKRTSIGRFCSIGNYVSTALGNHPTRDFVSTHPAFYSLSMKKMFGYVDQQMYNEWKWVDEDKRVSISIGNDVWIMNHAVIVEGVTIGDGAVICAGAVVAEDVPPYAVVGGVPARVIRYRFDDTTIQNLIEKKIWEHDLDWYSKNAYLFCDVDKFWGNEKIK